MSKAGQIVIARWRQRLDVAATRLNWIGALGIIVWFMFSGWLREATCASEAAGRSSKALDILNSGLPAVASVSFFLILTAFVMALVGWRPWPLAGSVLVWMAVSLSPLVVGPPMPCRYSANESFAVAFLRTINTAEEAYRSSAGKYGTIQDLIKEQFLDSRFGGNRPVSGYSFSVSLSSDEMTYVATAVPEARETGRFSYVSGENGTVRYSDDPAFAPPGQSGKIVE